MLRILLHPLALAVLATLSIWAAVIVVWQETVHPVSIEDIVLYLVGLPLLVLGIGLGIRTAYRRKQAMAKEGNSAVNATERNDMAGTDSATEGQFVVAIWGVGVSCPAGNDVATAYSALKAKKVRPLPDNEITNRDGFPVMSSRVADLSLAETETALLHSGMPPPASMLRAITLLKDAIAPIAETLEVIALDTFDKDRARSELPAPKLIVDVLVPVNWDTPHRRQVAAVVNCLLGDIQWPDESRFLRVIDNSQCNSAIHQVDRFNLEVNRTDSNDYYLLLACESALDQDVVSSLERRNLLFGSSVPKGQIPGEGAAAILLSRLPKDELPRTPLALFGRSAVAARAKSIDSSGRAGHDELLAVAQASLANMLIQPSDVGGIFSDIDQHSARCSECLGAMNDLAPHLDPLEQFVGIGQAIGRLDTVGALLSMGIAAEAASSEKMPVLLVAALHPTERVAVIVRPPVEAAAV